MTRWQRRLRLGLAVGTAQWHTKRIYAKLGVRNRTQAVVRAMEGEACLAGCESCVIAAHCGLASALDDAHQAFLSNLDEVSIATIIRKGKRDVSGSFGPPVMNV